VEETLKLPAILLEGDDSETDLLRGPGQKYAVSATQVVASGADDMALRPPESLPLSCDSGKLVLIARDPKCLVAQWDLSDEQQRLYNSLSATGRLSIRVYRRSVGGPVAAMAEVHADSRHWFLHVDPSGEACVAQLGYQRPDGGWVAVATSELVYTPPSERSEERLDVFARLPLDMPLDQFRSPLPPACQRAPVTVASGPAATAVAHFPEAPELPVVPQSPPPEHLWERTQEATGGLSAPPAESQAPRPAPSVFLEPEPGLVWTPAQEQALAEVIGESLARHEWIASEGIEGVIQGREREDGRGPHASLSSLAAAQEISGASPTSPAPQGPPARQGFWFNVNAELVIYGSTERDATVTIGGRLIKLRSDGSFSYRFALPDGCYELPAQAVSARGHDSRSANLEFSRQTVYAGEVGAHAQDPALKPPSPSNLSS
jgi:hypothetical protein